MDLAEQRARPGVELAPEEGRDVERAPASDARRPGSVRASCTSRLRIGFGHARPRPPRAPSRAALERDLAAVPVAGADAGSARAVGGGPLRRHRRRPAPRGPGCWAAGRPARSRRHVKRQRLRRRRPPRRAPGCRATSKAASRRSPQAGQSATLTRRAPNRSTRAASAAGRRAGRRCSAGQLLGGVSGQAAPSSASARSAGGSAAPSLPDVEQLARRQGTHGAPRPAAR